MRTLRDLVVQEPLVLAAEDERDRPRLREREEVRRTVARRLHVLAVEPFARRRADDRDAVRDRLFQTRELLARVQDVGRVHREPLALLPRILEIRRGKAQVADAHVRHRAAGGADVAGVERADEHDANVVQRRVHRAPPVGSLNSSPSNTSR